MKRLVGLVLILILVSVCHGDDLAFNLLKKTSITLNIIDTWTTFGLLQSERYRESNPLWAPIIHRQGLVLALDFGMALAVEYGFNALYDWNKPLTYVMLGALVIAQGYCVWNNWGLLR